MKTSLIFTLLVLVGISSARADSDLSAQLDDLKMPGNVAPAGVTSEKLYAVQNRYVNLDQRFELTLGGAKNFTGNGFLQMSQIDAGINYHLNNRFSLGLSGSYGFNDFTASANRLIQEERIMPDAAIVKWRSDLLLSYNLFYGKFRVSMDQVFYFDQYVSVGPGLVNTQYGTAPSAVADVGFALWFGKNWSAKFGAKNTLFNEQRYTGSDMAYHLLGHIDVGYLLGGEDRAYE
jgi:outer membrane beta-barrel protein